jgi:hypothetical protein
VKQKAPPRRYVRCGAFVYLNGPGRSRTSDLTLISQMLQEVKSDTGSEKPRQIARSAGLPRPASRKVSEVTDSTNGQHAKPARKATSPRQLIRGGS